MAPLHPPHGCEFKTKATWRELKTRMIRVESFQYWTSRMILVESFYQNHSRAERLKERYYRVGK